MRIKLENNWKCHYNFSLATNNKACKLRFNIKMCTISKIEVVRAWIRGNSQLKFVAFESQIIL